MIFLHIPHTCGLNINFALQKNNIEYVYVHNELDILKLQELRKYDINYFVLRNPIERVIGEAIHYVGRYKSTKSKVNNVKLPNIYYESIQKYVTHESRRDLCCKYLLKKTNFNIPLTLLDFNNLIKLVNSGKLIWDNYSYPIKTPVLNKFLNKDIELFLKNNDHKTMMYNKSILKSKYSSLESTLMKLNNYDMQLWNYIENMEITN